MKIQKTLISNKEVIVESGRSVLKKKRKIVFKPYSQHQDFLLPKSLSDYVEPGHIAKLISSVIDQMDTSKIVETYQGGGTSAYNPKMLLKDWILGFVNKIYSSRMLAKQLRENLESDKGKDLRKRRGNEIESVFGDGKMNKNKGRYLLRGLAKVNIEAGLYYISHNIRKIQRLLWQKEQMLN